MQFRNGSGKGPVQGSRQSQGSGGTERMWEPHRVQTGKGGQESQRVMENKEDGVFPHQIVDFAPVPAPVPAPLGKHLGDKVMIKLRKQGSLQLPK